MENVRIGEGSQDQNGVSSRKGNGVESVCVKLNRLIEGTANRSVLARRHEKSAGQHKATSTLCACEEATGQTL